MMISGKFVIPGVSNYFGAYLQGLYDLIKPYPSPLDMKVIM